MGDTQRITSFNHSKHLQLLSKTHHFQSSATNWSRNENGFITIACLSLLPIIILSVLCALATHWFIEKKEEIQWLCEKENLELQKTLIHGLNQLLLLNPIIEATVIEKKMVQMARAAAPTPAEKSALTAQLILLKIKLSNYILQQKSVIKTTHLAAQKKNFLIKTKLKQKIEFMSKQWNTPLQLHYRPQIPSIALKRKKIDPLGYLYVEHALLTQQQQVQIVLAITGEKLFPQWLRWLTTKPLRWQESCTSQPEKENLQWIAKLHLDKF